MHRLAGPALSLQPFIGVDKKFQCASGFVTSRKGRFGCVANVVEERSDDLISLFIDLSQVLAHFGRPYFTGDLSLFLDAGLPFVDVGRVEEDFGRSDSVDYGENALLVVGVKIQLVLAA